MSSVKAITSRGFNLIEAAIVLGVVGLVIGGIWVAAAEVHRNMRINRALAEIESVLGGLDSLYGGKALPDVATNYTSLLLNAGAIPADLIQNGVASNPWGGTLDVRTPYPGFGDPVRLTFTNVPSGDCVKFVIKAVGGLNADLTAGPRGMNMIMINSIPVSQALLSSGMSAFIAIIQARCSMVSAPTVRFEYVYPYAKQY